MVIAGIVVVAAVAAHPAARAAQRFIEREVPRDGVEEVVGARA